VPLMQPVKTAQGKGGRTLGVGRGSQRNHSEQRSGNATKPTRAAGQGDLPMATL
jgi:hypothetical protein